MSKMQDNTAPRRTMRARIIHYTARAAELETVLADVLADGQRAILADELRALAERAQLSARAFGTTHAFFLAAAQVPGTACVRNKVEEIIDLIASGEPFADYRPGDGLRHWQERRTARTRAMTFSVTLELTRVLASPKTPTNYKEALTAALQTYAHVTGTRYDSANIADMMGEAAANCARAGYYDHRHPLHVAWSNICDLLQGLRKRRPCASIALKPIVTDRQNCTQSNHPAPVTHKLYLTETISEFLSYGMRSGDDLEAVEVSELQAGDFAAYIVSSKPRDFYVAQIVNYTADKISLKVNGQTLTYRRARLIRLCRITQYTHKIKPPAVEPNQTDIASQEHERQIAALRARLDRLDADDITDSTARFKLEKQIYDLEREQERDEWPELINA